MLVGSAVFNTLLSRYAAASMMPWVLLAPVVAMASAWLLLSQAPNAAEICGGLLLLAGVMVVFRPQPSEWVLTPRGTSTHSDDAVALGLTLLHSD